MNPNEYQSSPSNSILASELALSKAMANISELQGNLHFMLELNEKLQTENAKLKALNEKYVEQIKKEQL